MRTLDSRRIAPATATAERLAAYFRLMGLNARLRNLASAVRIEITQPNATAANEGTLVTLEVTDDECRIVEPDASEALSWQEAIAAVGRLAERDPPRLLRAG